MRCFILNDISATPTFDLTLAMLSASYPSPFGGVANVDFSETARLSSLSFFDAGGAPIDFGTITGASGRLYDAEGVHMAGGGGGGGGGGPVPAMPEPAAWAIMLSGVALIAAALRRRRRQPSRIESRVASFA